MMVRRLPSVCFSAVSSPKKSVTRDADHPCNTAQVAWFEQVLKDHPSKDGWKIFVFTHAPPNGSGLRVLQENHVVNGCCWLNHSSGDITKKYIDLVRKHRCIKAWFSGHFHLGQDYEDSITFPAGNNRGSCVFVQTAVMRSGTTRDGRQQSRLLKGTKDGFEVFTVNHAKGGEVRLDATITYSSCNEETAVSAHPSEDYDHDQFFSAYTPSDDGTFTLTCPTRTIFNGSHVAFTAHFNPLPPLLAHASLQHGIASLCARWLRNHVRPGHYS